MPDIRIASLVPSLTELLFDLGLEESIVARTGFCVHPRDKVRRVQKVGGTKDVDVEKLLGTKPTHLVVNIDENRKDTVAALGARIQHIVVTHPLVPDDNLVIYREFGRLFNCADGARSLEREFQAARSDLVEKIGDLRKLKVLYLIWKDPWFAVSRDTYVSALLALANLETVPASADVRYPALAATHSAWQEADCILLSSEPFAFRQQHADALSHSLQPPKPVMLVDGELMSWYGSRAIEGLRYLPGLRSQVEALIGG